MDVGKWYMTERGKGKYLEREVKAATVEVLIPLPDS